MGTAAPGTKLGRYQVVKHLASGGMAEVLLALATGIEGFTRHVVLKRIRPGHADNAQFVQMFLNEARLAAQLHHQNIVQVHDIGQEGDEYFFAMEYVHGEDLRRLLTNVARRQEKVPLEHVVSIISACAVGLHHAHEQLGQDRKPLQIVHRDVSPANILVGYDGNVKVVDFGIAKAAASTHEATVAGALKGKASYMAPEQCTGKGLIDRRTDVFALGIVLYELATTRRLFKGANDFLTMSAIVAGNVPPARTHRPDLPEALDAIIMKALSLSPADRFQTADEMHDALERFANTARVRPSTSSLAAYMKSQFGERLEPWLVAEEPPHADVAVDFDGSASGMAPPPSEAVEGNAIPESVEFVPSAPIVRARTKAATNAPSLSAVSTQKSGPSKMRTPTRQVAIPDAAASPSKSGSVRRPTIVDGRTAAAPPPSPPVRRKPITVQIPIAAQAAGAGVTVPRTNGSSSLPGMSQGDRSAVPRDIDTAWDASRPMAVAATATMMAGEQSKVADDAASAASLAAPAAATNGSGSTTQSDATASKTAVKPTSTSDDPSDGPGETTEAATAKGKPAAAAPGTAASAALNGAAPKPPTGTSASTPTSTSTPSRTVSSALKSDPAINVPGAATEPASIGAAPKSDPAIRVPGAPTKPASMGTAPKSDPAISVPGVATKPASMSSAPKSDPAIAVPGAKPASMSSAPKSDPAIAVPGAKLASMGTAPKSDPAIAVPASAKPADSSRLPANTFTSGVTGPAISRTATTPLPGMTKGPAATDMAAATAKQPGAPLASSTSSTSSTTPATSTTSTTPATSDAPVATPTPPASAANITPAQRPLPGMTAASPRPLPGMTAPNAAITPAITPEAGPAIGRTPTPLTAAGPAIGRTPTPLPGASTADASGRLTPVVGDSSKPKLPAPRRAKVTNAPPTDASDASGVTPATTGATAGAATDLTGAAGTDAADATDATDASSPFTAVPADSPFAPPAPFAAAPDNSDDTPSPFAAASPLATAASTVPAAGSDPLAPRGAPIVVPTEAPSPWASDDDDAYVEPKGALAKLLGSPKRIAIAAGAAVLLVVVLVMAMSGGHKKKPATTTAANSGRGHGSDDTKAKASDDDKPAVAEDPAGGSAAGSADTGSAAEPPAPKAAVKRPTKKTTAKTTVAKATTKPKTTTTKPKTTATKTVAKTATKTATTTKTPKAAVQKPAAKKCDPNALFPCKKK